MKAMKNNLNPKQALFCKLYIRDFNATRAAIDAGYSKKTARNISSEHLTKPHIQTEVKRLKDKLFKKAELTTDMIAAQLKKIGFADIKDFVNNDGSLKDLKHVDGTLIQEITKSNYKGGEQTKIKKQDAIKALELLGKYKGMFIDRTEIITDIPVQFTIHGVANKYPKVGEPGDNKELPASERQTKKISGKHE